MKIKYFQDTDTLHIEFRSVDVAETRDLDENTLLDIDKEGNICGITVEHASDRAGIPAFSFEQISALHADEPSAAARYPRRYVPRRGLSASR
jgi:uncharacterized protein YuzE